MVPRNRLLSMLALSLILVAGDGRCSDEMTNLLKIGTVQIKAKVGKANIEVTIGTKRSTPVHLDVEAAANATLDELKCNPTDVCLAVERFSISVNGKRIAVPLSVYSDFTNLGLGRIAAHKEGYELLLIAGDGVTSREIRIVFSDDRVIRRSVYSDMAEDGKPVQETNYR